MHVFNQKICIEITSVKYGLYLGKVVYIHNNEKWHETIYLI